MTINDAKTRLLGLLDPQVKAPRDLVVRGVQGAALAVGLWCVLLAFQLLPGSTADTPGVTGALLIGLVVGATRFRSLLFGALGLGAAAVVLVSCTTISEVIESRWVRNDPLPDSGVGAIVALSSGVRGDTTIDGEALDHLIMALQLVRQGVSGVLLTTTVETQYPGGFVSSQTDQARIVGLFGAGVTWMRTPLGNNTRDEAVESAKLFVPRGIRRIAVVTSPMHTRRACSTFAAVGFDVVCIAARMRSLGGRPTPPWPQDRMVTFGSFVYELAGMAEYRLRGWLKPPARD